MTKIVRTVTVKSTTAKLAHTVEVGPHKLLADEPLDEGGDDTAPSPFEYLSTALATCTAMTIKVYSARKSWPVEGVVVNVEQIRSNEQTVFKRTIALQGPLDAEQRQRLLEIANRCPVHKALSGKLVIETALP
jgi:putative redox protein